MATYEVTPLRPTLSPEQATVVDDVMALFYALSCTSLYEIDQGNSLKERGAAYVGAVIAVVEATNRATPSLSWGEDGNASFFWTHKIMLRTRWALANGAPPEIVRFLAHVHFT